MINQYLHLICDERLFLCFTESGDSSSTVKIILIQFVTQLWLQSIRGTVSQLKGFLKFVVIIVSFLLIAHMKSLPNFVHGHEDNISKNMVFKGEGCRAREKCRSGQVDFLVGQVTFKSYLYLGSDLLKK